MKKIEPVNPVFKIWYDYNRLIWKAIESRCKTQELKEVAYQESIFAVNKAVSTYNPNKKTKLSSYIYKHILWMISRLKQYYLNHKPVYLSNFEFDDYTSLDDYNDKVDLIADSNNSIIHLENEMDNIIDTKHLYKALNCLPEKYQYVIRSIYGLGCKKKTNIEIAKELNVHPTWSSTMKINALYKLRRYFKNHSLIA